MSVIPSSLSRFAVKLRPSDLAASAAAPFLAVMLRDVSYFKENEVGTLVVYCAVAAAASAVALAYFRVAQILPDYLSLSDAKRILKAAAVACLLTTVVMFSATRLEGFPRSMPILHFFVLGTFLFAGRLAGADRSRRRVRSEQGRAAEGDNILLVGANTLASLYLRMLEASPAPRSRVLAILDSDRRLHGRSIGGHLVMGGVESAAAVIAEYAIHGVVVNKVVITYPDKASQTAAIEMISGSCGDGVRVEVLAERLGLVAETPFEDSAPEAAEDPVPVVLYWRARRAVDIILSAVALVLLAPLFALTALLVWRDVGLPTLFWQERVGRGGRKFMVHKFRTLKAPVDASGRLLKDDERLSVIGRFLRATRLDELPQLYDILRGDMSIIGPRPLLPVDLPEDCSIRLSVRPGLTGWAQIHGGKSVTAEEKNALDEWYIRHASIWLDLRIIWLTVRTVLRGDVRNDEAIAEALGNRTTAVYESTKSGVSQAGAWTASGGGGAIRAIPVRKAEM